MSPKHENLNDKMFFQKEIFLSDLIPRNDLKLNLINAFYFQGIVWRQVLSFLEA